MGEHYKYGPLERSVSGREFLRGAIRLALAGGVASLGGIGYAHEIEPGWLDVSSVQLRLPRLSRRFNGYRIAQISDIHVDGWTGGARLRAIVATVNSERPDLVAITGDFVSHDAESAAPTLVEALSDLTAPDGVVAVLGNHDHWSDAGAIKQMLADSGITNLSNRVKTLERGRSLFHVAGVDDIWERKARLESVLEALPREGAAMLLAHEPDFADTAAQTGRFDLQVSGHSHGGQIVVPFLGPPRLPHLGRKYHTGLYRVGSMLQYTNRGVGMIQPYVRFNCRPEVTVFTLQSATEG